MVTLWARCTALRTDRPSTQEIRIHLGQDGDRHIVSAGLAEKDGDGVRVLGGGLSGGDEDRFSWFDPIRQRNRAAGEARAKSAARDERGRMRPATIQPSLQPDPGNVQRPSSQASQDCSHPDSSPASGFRIPEDQKLSPARDPRVPDATPAPSAGPPPPSSDWDQRMSWWKFMLAADDRIRSTGIEANAQRLPPAPAGANENNLATCAKNLALAGYSPDEVDAKMRHIVLVAEAEALREGHRRWFKPALIWDPLRASRAVDTSLEEAKRSRAPPSSGPRRDRPPEPTNRQRPL